LVSLAKTLGYCDYDLSEVAHEKIKTYRDTSGIDLDEFKQMLDIPNKDTLKGKRDYAILILFFETAIRRGEVTKINIVDYEQEKIKTYRDTTGIELDEFKQMLDIPNKDTLKGKRDYAILILFFETAIRRGEVTKINIVDYEPEKNVIWIIGKGRGTQKESITI